MMLFVKYLAWAGILFALSGCASMNQLLSSLDGDKGVPPLKDIYKAPRYSDNENLSVPTDRNYRRMTKNRMEEESQLQSNAGSMWVMEGQGSYLFAQNKMRKEGDVLNVALDPSAKGQIDTKVSVIKKLLKQLDDQKKLDLRTAKKTTGEAERTPASADAAKTEKDDKEEKEEPIEIAKVPSKIVEKLADGNYRIKGQQPFMIGKRDYKVIITGLIRPEDFNDEGVSTEKLIDPQYDVVSLRKVKSNE